MSDVMKGAGYATLLTEMGPHFTFIEVTDSGLKAFHP